MIWKNLSHGHKNVIISFPLRSVIPVFLAGESIFDQDQEVTYQVKSQQSKQWKLLAKYPQNGIWASNQNMTLPEESKHLLYSELMINDSFRFWIQKIVSKVWQTIRPLLPIFSVIQYTISNESRPFLAFKHMLVFQSGIGLDSETILGKYERTRNNFFPRKKKKLRVKGSSLV